MATTEAGLQAKYLGNASETRMNATWLSIAQCLFFAVAFLAWVLGSLLLGYGEVVQSAICAAIGMPCGLVYLCLRAYAKGL